MKNLNLLIVYLSLLVACKTTKTMSAYTPIINNKQGNPIALVSQSEAFKIKITSWAEPNNGRMLWQADVFLNEEKINKKIYERTWNYINYSIDKIMIADKKENYWYIPVEGTSRLIRKSDQQVFKLPNQGTSTSRFKGNSFAYGYLLEVSTNTQLLLIFSGFFLRYFPSKNKPVAVLCIDFLKKTTEKISSLKF